MKFVSGTNLERFADKFKEWVSNLFQPKLTSGTNIKTINNTSLLGSGDIDTSEVFMITFTNSSDIWSVDCTATQLTDAVASGKQLMGKYTTSGALGGTSYYRLQHDMSGMINSWVFHCKAPNSAPNTLTINNMMGTLGVTASYDVWYWSIVFDYDSDTDTWSCDKTWTDISMQMMTSVSTGDGTNIVGRYGESYYYADNIQLMDNTLTMSCDNPVAGDPYKFTVSAAVPNTDPPVITPDFLGQDTFIVEFINTNGTWSVSCTADEIVAATSGNKVIVGKYTSTNLMGDVNTYYSLDVANSGMFNGWTFVNTRATNGTPNILTVLLMSGSLSVTASVDTSVFAMTFSQDSQTSDWIVNKTWSEISQQTVQAIMSSTGTKIVGRYDASFYYLDSTLSGSGGLVMSCANPYAGDPYSFTIEPATITTDPPVITPDWDGKMSNPMTTAGDIIYSSDNTGTPARLAKGTTGNLLRAGTNGPEYSDALPYLTTAPSADNTDGIKIVVLSSQPSTLYNGYLYLILGS